MVDINTNIKTVIYMIEINTNDTTIKAAIYKWSISTRSTQILKPPFIHGQYQHDRHKY